MERLSKKRANEDDIHSLSLLLSAACICGIPVDDSFIPGIPADSAVAKNNAIVIILIPRSFELVIILFNR